ncbi:MAG TPA: amino acid racemase [Candidatus Nanoarchaeia archaeon]|nr:amino acid racemase [Candidatus Nanoarchaeia archaeon]
MRYKKIGILGGMGPEATAQLYIEIIQIFQRRYGAKYDSDFPEIMILNLPLPDVVEEKGSPAKIIELLQEGVKKLEQAGADFIAIPCNTAITFLPQMSEAVSIPFVNIVEETATFVKKRGLTQVGIVATQMTLRSGIYSRAIGQILLEPSEEQKSLITKIIMTILAGEKNDEAKNNLQNIIFDLRMRGAKAVILGCTELPLLFASEDTIDTIKVLAEAVVREAIDI